MNDDGQQPEVYKTYDDGYVVRAMTQADARVVQHWFRTHMGINSRYDLDVSLQAFPRGSRGFYIGEYEGHVVASAVRLPWGPGLYYGSYYYVDEPYRGRGFGTRLRDEVAFGHVGDCVLAIDSVTGTTAEKNIANFGYVKRWMTIRYQFTAKRADEPQSINIVKADTVPAATILDYDDRMFASRGFGPRHEFLRLWMAVEGGAARVALGEGDEGMVGLVCRVPAMQPRHHLIGPLYAEDTNTALALVQSVCENVVDEQITINIWSHHEAAVELVALLDAQHVFDAVRMHANGDAAEFKRTTFALTSLCVCGF